jgi:uncharacterized metal-binding protein YceD (DUF177 family)
MELAVWIRFSDIVQPVEIQERIHGLSLDFGYHYELAVDPLELSFTAQPTKLGHRLEGGFDYSAAAPCVRCLKTVPMKGSAHFDLEFRPASQAPEEEDVELAPGEVEIIYYEEDKLPLEEIVSQQMYLELPDKLLCREDCKGLCPTCGADLNEGACGCVASPDARWSSLPSSPPPQASPPKQKES